jgi:hypothetical protein
VAVSVSIALNHASRNQEQRGSFRKSDGGSLAGGMGKQAEREAGGGKLRDTGAVVEKRGGMSGIGIAEGAKFLVVAGDESGTGVNAAADVDKLAVDVKTKFSHRVGFVDVGRRKQLGTQSAKDFLRGNKEIAVFIAPPGNVQQAYEHTFWADADGIIEISGQPLAYENRSDVSSIEFGEHGWDRLHPRSFSLAGMKSGKHGTTAHGEGSTRVKVGQPL